MDGLENLLERKTISPKEKILLDQLSTKKKKEEYSFANGFALYDPKTLTPVMKPALDKKSDYEGMMVFFKNPFGLSMPMVKIWQAFDDLAVLLETHKGFEYVA